MRFVDKQFIQGSRNELIGSELAGANYDIYGQEFLTLLDHYDRFRGGQAPWAENIYHHRRTSQNKLKSDYHSIQTNKVLNSVTAFQRQNQDPRIFLRLEKDPRSQQQKTLSEAIEESSKRITSLDRVLQKKLERLKILNGGSVSSPYLEQNTRKSKASKLAVGGTKRQNGLNRQLHEYKSNTVSNIQRALPSKSITFGSLKPIGPTHLNYPTVKRIDDSDGSPISTESVRRQPFGMLPWSMDKVQGTSYKVNAGAGDRRQRFAMYAILQSLRHKFFEKLSRMVG